MLRCLIVDPHKQQGGEPPKNVQVVNDITKCDFIIVYGGDGTLLSTFRQMSLANVDFKHVVLAGLNKGTLGFMANDMMEGDFLKSTASAVSAYKHTHTSTVIQQRALLHVEVVCARGNPQHHLVLNEVSIHPTFVGSLFDTHVAVNLPNHPSQYLQYKGDGIVLCTASGSTAYNLSVNGPILMPDNNSMVLSPICPFSLASRPIVLSQYARLTIPIDVNNSKVVLDGIPLDVPDVTKLNIVVSNTCLNLYKNTAFFNNIVYKLGWNNSIK